jgi:cytidylate kinase
MSRGIALDDEQGVGALVHDFPLGLIYTPAGGVVVTLGDEHNKADLSLEEVSRGASVVARYPQVREKLLAAQREAFLPDGIVAEGRDMGTVVFPDATTKFFVVASVDVRAERRFRQLTESGQHPVLEDIKRDLQERDERDATREVAPMKPAEGALVIDNSKSQLEEVVEQMAQRVLEHRE